MIFKMLKLIKKILLMTFKIFFGFCALVILFFIWFLYSISGDNTTSSVEVNTDATRNIASNNIRDTLPSESNDLTNKRIRKNENEKENQVLNGIGNENTPSLSTTRNRSSFYSSPPEHNPNNINRGNASENVNNLIENMNNLVINDPDSNSDLHTESTRKEKEGSLKQNNGFITFNNGLQIETTKMLKISEFYTALNSPKENKFRSTNINPQESEKIKNYINEFCKNGYRNSKELCRMLVYRKIVRDREVENLIKNMELNENISEQIKNGYFYTIVSKKLEGNITTKGTIKKLLKSCQNKEIANILKDIKEVEILHQIDKEIIKTSYTNKFVDLFNDSVIIDTKELVHLDYSEVFLTKIQAEKIIDLEKQHTEIDKIASLFFKIFSIESRKKFLVDFYSHIKESGVVIPEILIDKVAKVIIKNPTQIDINIEKFYDKESLQKALSDKNSECDTDYDLEDIEKFENFEKCDKEKEKCKENEEKFNNMKKMLKRLTEDKFGEFFQILSDEKIDVI